MAGSGQPIGDSLAHDPVYTESLPQFLQLLSEFNLPATFFVVGRDASIPEKHDQLRAVHQRGHEIANHAFSHVLGLTALPANEIADEIIRTQEALHAVTGIYPLGFRAPGYDVNEQILSVLRDLEFQYDSSLFPTPFGIALRAVDRYLSRRLWTTKRQFGRFRDAFAPLSPYYPHPDDLRDRITRPHIMRENAMLLEIPISVTPALRLPMHCGIALVAGLKYFRRCAEQFMRRGIPLVYLFHGIDLVDTSRHPVFANTHRGAFFFSAAFERKAHIVREILRHLAANFRPMLTRDWIAEYRGQSRL